MRFSRPAMIMVPVPMTKLPKESVRRAGRGVFFVAIGRRSIPVERRRLTSSCRLRVAKMHQARLVREPAGARVLGRARTAPPRVALLACPGVFGQHLVEDGDHFL